MKAFHFRLEQARRWRSAQLDLEKARVFAAATQLQDIRSAVESIHAQLKSGGAGVAAPGNTGSSLQLWDQFADRSRRKIRELEARAVQAEKALTAQMQLLIEASRKLQLLENLKERAAAQWTAAFDRELETFAAECFLAGLQSRKRTGA